MRFPPVSVGPSSARCAVAVCALLFSSAAWAQPAPRAELTEKFRAQLAAIAQRTNGVVGIGVIDLTTGDRIGVNDSATFPQGSAIKVSILLELFRQRDAGALRLDERVAMRAADRAGGSGITQYFGDGASALSLGDLAVLMIVLSDNTATNLLIDRVGMERVNALMQQLRLPGIRLQRRMIRPAESAAGRENVATPAQAAQLLQRLHACDLPISRASCEEVRRILEIPKAGSVPASLPGDVRVAWKGGSVEGVETAWALVALPGRPYVITVMVTYGDAAEALAAIRQVADASWEYFRRLARASAYGVRVPLSLVDSIRTP
ncbi:MAG: serine hydrolase [Gemmatimonadaceae bacterium]|nr:serine hydrolase [Gemmatimonadaceae bacterium]